MTHVLVHLALIILNTLCMVASIGNPIPFLLNLAAIIINLWILKENFK